MSNQTIAEYLTVQSILTNSSLSGFFALDINEFTQCEEYPIFKAISVDFGVVNVVVVEYKSGLPNKIYNPALWYDPETDNLVYKVGNSLFKLIVVSEDSGKQILSFENSTEISLYYDTKEVNKKSFLFFSYYSFISEIEDIEIKIELIYKDVEDPNIFNNKINQIKSLFRKNQYNEALTLLKPLVKELPKIKSSATISDVFKHIMVSGLYDEICKKTKFALVVYNPKVVQDKYGTTVEFTFSGKEFSQRINLDYDVKSWGDTKKLSEIDTLVFKSNHVDNSGYLTKIVSNETNSAFAILLISGPNKKDPSFFPQFTFIEGDQILKSVQLRETIRNIIPAINFEEMEKLKVDNSHIDGKFLAATKELTFD